MYDSRKLPNDWNWAGAIAGPNGFNGHAHLANVARDPGGQLWVFAEAGRYRIHQEQFERKLISRRPLAGLPLKLQPSN